VGVGFRSAELARAFHDEGYAAVPFLNAEELARARKLFADLNSGCQSGFYSTLWSGDLDYRRHVHGELKDILSRPIREIAEGYRMCLANFAVKQPQKADSKVPIHQDWSMVDETKHFAIAVWCPLVDVDSENGCLAVVPRSHRIVSNIRCNHSNDTSYSPFYNLFGRLEENYLREVPMKAGEAIIYQQGLLHGSKANQSPTPRAAIVAVYLPENATIKHYYQNSATSIDEYDVEEDFYWKTAQIASPPVGQKLVGNRKPDWKDVVEEDVIAMLQGEAVA
jgi:hypothetical protein